MMAIFCFGGSAKMGSQLGCAAPIAIWYYSGFRSSLCIVLLIPICSLFSHYFFLFVKVKVLSCSFGDLLVFRIGC